MDSLFITINQWMTTGSCLPIAAAGSSAATVRKMLASSNFCRGSTLFHKGAGGLIGALGLYFISLPFI